MASVKIKLLSFTLMFFSFESEAQSIAGRWYSLDPNDEKETIIELYEKNTKLYGKVVALLQEEDRSKTCRKCPGKFKDQPLLGLEILSDFSGEGDHWTDGTILVPKTGRHYKCNITMDREGRLEIRGYVGISILGRSTYWYRAEEE